MSSTMLARLYFAQGGECFYCSRQTWLMNGGESRRAAKQRLGIGPQSPRRALDRRQATKEHLRRVADGGTNDADNLIMCCAECNHTRGETPVLLHFAAMRADIRVG